MSNDTTSEGFNPPLTPVQSSPYYQTARTINSNGDLRRLPNRVMAGFTLPAVSKADFAVSPYSDFAAERAFPPSSCHGDGLFGDVHYAEMIWTPSHAGRWPVTIHYIPPSQTTDVNFGQEYIIAGLTPTQKGEPLATDMIIYSLGTALGRSDTQKIGGEDVHLMQRLYYGLTQHPQSYPEDRWTPTEVLESYPELADKHPLHIDLSTDDHTSDQLAGLTENSTGDILTALITLSAVADGFTATIKSLFPDQAAKYTFADAL